MKQFYLLTLAAILTLTACSKDEGPDVPPSLTIEQTEYTLGALDNKTKTISFSVTTDWTLYIGSYDVDEDWLSATPASGAAGEQSIEISALDNTSAEPRTGYIEILYGDQTELLTISQKGIFDDKDFTDEFDPTFAKLLQELGYISNAEKNLYRTVIIQTNKDNKMRYNKIGNGDNIRLLFSVALVLVTTEAQKDILTC